jgi:hypothetical protein
MAPELTAGAKIQIAFLLVIIVISTLKPWGRRPSKVKAES